jgi:hypothetical protein
MPKDIINYSSTIIYKIVCKDLNIKDLYVGHTTNFIKRKQYHKSDCNNPNSTHYNYKVYSTVRDNGGWDNWDMIEIEKYSCKDANEARARERYWYEELKANLNSIRPISSKEEQKELYKITNKEYVKKNEEFIKQYQTDWYEENQDIVKKNQKEYYDIKGKFLKGEKITCECGKTLRKDGLKTHYTSVKHKEYLANIVVGV